MPLFYARGSAYLVNFYRCEKPRLETPKYVVCLQQGKIVTNRDTFTAVAMNTCKDNNPPPQFPWSIYVPPTVCKTEFGAIVNCSEIHTILKEEVIEYAYTLPDEIIKKVDRGLMYAIGLATLEELQQRYLEQKKRPS